MWNGCRKLSLMISRGELDHAPWTLKLWVHLHLAICRHCRLYRRQLRLITQALREISSRSFDAIRQNSLEERLIAHLKFLACLILPFSYLAAETTVSGVIFGHYEFVTSDYLANGVKAGNQNAFDLNQAYVKATAKFDERFDALIRLETKLSSRDNAANVAYLKQAWLRYKEIYPDASLTFGLAPNPWRDHEEGIWNHRFTAEILEDQEGLLNGSDRGLLLSGKFQQLVYNLQVVNGEGIGARGASGNETNRYKDYAGHFVFSPFKENVFQGVKINTYLQKGTKMAHWPRDRVFGGLSFQGSRFHLWGAYHASRDGAAVAAGTETVKGMGFSFHGSLQLRRDYLVFVRWDRWDPDAGLPDNSHDRVIYGVSKKLTQGIRVALDHQLIVQEKIAGNRRNQSFLFTHVEVKF